ncbi:SSU ribosomal protein S21p [Leptolyngbya sp. NIES-2104]|nr:SSU ribosomal protein S21p [Leptolyngbya sp. NIES-2104]
MWTAIFSPLESTNLNLIGGSSMTQVVLGENEGIDSALRRFKRQVSKAGILADLRSHRHFETPLEKRKRKAIVARRNRRYR